MTTVWPEVNSWSQWEDYVGRVVVVGRSPKRHTAANAVNRARGRRKREYVQEGGQDTYLDGDLDAHVLVLRPRVRRLIPQQCAIMT